MKSQGGNSPLPQRCKIAKIRWWETNLTTTESHFAKKINYKFEKQNKETYL